MAAQSFWVDRLIILQLQNFVSPYFLNEIGIFFVKPTYFGLSPFFSIPFCYRCLQIVKQLLEASDFILL